MFGIMNNSVEYIALEQTNLEKLNNSDEKQNETKNNQSDLIKFEDPKLNMASNPTKELREHDGLLDKQKQQCGTDDAKLKGNADVKDEKQRAKRSELVKKILKTISIDAAYFGAVGYWKTIKWFRAYEFLIIFKNVLDYFFQKYNCYSYI